MPPWKIVLFPQCHLSPEYERDDQDQRGLHAAQQSRWLAVVLEKWLYGIMELVAGVMLLNEPQISLTHFAVVLNNVHFRKYVRLNEPIVRR